VAGLWYHSALRPQLRGGATGQLTPPQNGWLRFTLYPVVQTIRISSIIRLVVLVELTSINWKVTVETKYKTWITLFKLQDTLAVLRDAGERVHDGLFPPCPFITGERRAEVSLLQKCRR